MISAEEFLRDHSPVIADAANGEAQLQVDPVAAHHVKPSGSRSRFTAARNEEAEHDVPEVSDDEVTGTSWVRRGSFRVTQASDPADYDACREAALRLLDAAARPTGALRTKLAERGYRSDVIDSVIDRLVELHLVDDEDYARRLVQSCAARQKGQRGTVMELVRKGVDHTLAERTVAQAAQSGVFDDAVWELGRRVARKTQGLDLQVRRRRFWSAAGRRGHDPQRIREVCDALFTADNAE